jgi:hypothetical protein
MIPKRAVVWGSSEQDAPASEPQPAIGASRHLDAPRTTQARNPWEYPRDRAQFLEYINCTAVAAQGDHLTAASLATTDERLQAPYRGLHSLFLNDNKTEFLALEHFELRNAYWWNDVRVVKEHGRSRIVTEKSISFTPNSTIHSAAPPSRLVVDHHSRPASGFRTKRGIVPVQLEMENAFSQ